jgi:hypothetical protein
MQALASRKPSSVQPTQEQRPGLDETPEPPHVTTASRPLRRPVVRHTPTVLAIVLALLLASGCGLGSSISNPFASEPPTQTPTMPTPPAAAPTAAPAAAAPPAAQPTPAFSPFWVKNHQFTEMWSGPMNGSGIVSFGTTSQQFCSFQVVLPPDGPRLYVFNPVSQNYFWIDADTVGPVGPPEQRAGQAPAGENCAEVVYSG